MRISANPFAILGASPRDSRRRLMELAENKAFDADQEVITKALSDLTHPVRRVPQEVAWFPGVSPARLSKIVAKVSVDRNYVPDVSELGELGVCNILAESLAASAGQDEAEACSTYILGLCDAFERIKAQDVLSRLNADRVAAGMPEIPSVDAVVDTISNRKGYFKQLLLDYLEKQNSDVLVDAVGSSVLKATSNGERFGPVLLEALVDGYELKVSGFLDDQSAKVLVRNLKILELASTLSSDDALVVSAREMYLELMVWHRVAQPMQVVARSRGIENVASRNLAFAIRGMAVDLNNKFDKRFLSRQITTTLLELFGRDRAIAEKSNEDFHQLKKLDEDSVKEAAAASYLNYEAEFGFFFKKVFSMTADSIIWDGRELKTAEVSGLRWGGTNRYVNGVQQGTDYVVGFCNTQIADEMKFTDSVAFSAITDRLWKAAGIQIMVRMISRLKEGQTLTFGSIVVDDLGVTLKRAGYVNKFNLHFKWSQVKVWSENGMFHIASNENKEYVASLSYQGDWNTHFLDHMIRSKFKKTGDLLSGAFD